MSSEKQEVETTDIYFLTMLEAGKSKIKVPAGYMSTKNFGFCLWLQMAAFLLCLTWPFYMEREREREIWCLFLQEH